MFLRYLAAQSDTSPSGLDERSIREWLAELSVEVDDDRLRRLGPPPGFSARRCTPTLTGFYAWCLSSLTLNGFYASCLSSLTLNGQSLVGHRPASMPPTIRPFDQRIDL